MDSAYDSKYIIDKQRCKNQLYNMTLLFIMKTIKLYFKNFCKKIVSIRIGCSI
jgi:hypothetical protein